MSSTKDIGTIAVSHVTSKLLTLGYAVLFPIGDNERYDLVVDMNAKLNRVQCKMGRIKNGALKFDTSSTNYTKGKWKRVKYTGQLEYFGVFCENKVYLVPASEVDELYEASLRIEPAKNGQVKNVRLASAYLV